MGSPWDLGAHQKSSQESRCWVEEEGGVHNLLMVMSQMMGSFLLEVMRVCRMRWIYLIQILLMTLMWRIMKMKLKTETVRVPYAMEHW
jgi:hypothetical protein